VQSPWSVGDNKKFMKFEKLFSPQRHRGHREFLPKCSFVQSGGTDWTKRFLPNWASTAKPLHFISRRAEGFSFVGPSRQTKTFPSLCSLCLSGETVGFQGLAFSLMYLMMSSVDVPGWKTARIPAFFSPAMSSTGMIPPQKI